MNFSVWPPEVNSVLLLDGPGSGPMLSAAAAWDGISSELSATANAFSSVTSDLAGQAWQGPASASMTNTAVRYLGWLGGAAAQAGQSAAQARAAATAYEAALATIVDPGLVTANRGQLASLVTSNLFGQNAPAIAAAEAEYEQMWAQDVAAMSGYHLSASAAVTQLESWGQALEGLPGTSAQLAKTLENGFAVVEQEIQQTPTNLATVITGTANTLFVDIFGSPAAPPFSATQAGTFTGTPSLATRLEVAALWPVKDALGFFPGLETQLAVPGDPLLSLFTGNNPLFGLFLGNTPPQLLTLLLGETVQHTTYNGMSVVQITPAHPSGNYVVAIHGGAFIFPPSLFHWLDYTVMAYQTGATIEVPIYPLLQQGGTAGTVVPLMAGFISTQIAAYGAPHVSVIGDSSGGNLALAAAEYMVAQGDPVPASMVLLSPWLNLAMTNPNIAYVQDPLLSSGPAQVLGKVWAGDLPVSNYMVSPLNGSLSGLPPTTVYSGNLDILSPDVLVLQQEAAAAGAPFSFVLANGEIHDWIILTVDGPQYWPQIDQELGV
ncbi:PPE family protein [Mycobacterium malmoense]|uniref:triacylglycerol lipase LipY n=1 Tax=Mycobacterium malmoense TaxID=1780 RepID=UPI001594434D|nr:PPE family protein [Mycobacterium malmoense]QZA16081.1 PPE family protein [Mycobacterium malmoense]UNB92893.1 PPE family protein [Mycobacterium malmoense]